MKTVKAVQPYFFKNHINFKYKPYNTWIELGGKTVSSHYPLRIFHVFAYKHELPIFCQSKYEARLRFVQPYSLSFDTFPDYSFYEIIPFFWDCWPDNLEKVCSWLSRHSTKTAIFTSSQISDIVRRKFPVMNVLTITEGIDVDTYKRGNQLIDRNIDFLEYGRNISEVVVYDESGIKYVHGKKNGIPIFTQEQLVNNLSDTKIVAAYPKLWTNPKGAGGIETLTQRYWECMLSRCVMIGHAPKELTELVGYNPVIELDKNNPDRQLRDILTQIQDYQELVDKNWETAIKYGDWNFSMKKVIEFLKSNNYQI